MISKIVEKTGTALFVFVTIFTFLIIEMALEFEYIDFVYSLIVLFYFVKYLKIKSN